MLCMSNSSPYETRVGPACNFPPGIGNLLLILNLLATAMPHTKSCQDLCPFLYTSRITFKQDRYADTGIVVIRPLQKTSQHISISHWILALLSSFVEFSQTLESHIHPWKSISWFTASSIPGASTWHLKMFVAPPDGSIKPSALALDAIFKCSNSRHPCTFLILCDEFLST